jgi:hypothetical protein
MQYSYSKKIFTGRGKLIGIIGGPDDKCPDKWSYAVLTATGRVTRVI